MNYEEAAKKLNALPWQALYALVVEKQIDKEEIKRKEKSEIILRLLISTITEAEIEALIDDYTYGNRVTFTPLEVFKNPIRRRYICAKSFIDEYIRYGGTMSFGGVHYNETSPFASKESADAYVDTAIARNIQYSLRCYQYERYFHHLRDLTREIDVLHLPDVGTKSDRTVITQPGLRYVQAETLIHSLLQDETFSTLSLAERTAIRSTWKSAHRRSSAIAQSPGSLSFIAGENTCITEPPP